MAAGRLGFLLGITLSVFFASGLSRAQPAPGVGDTTVLDAALSSQVTTLIEQGHLSEAKVLLEARPPNARSAEGPLLAQLREVLAHERVVDTYLHADRPAKALATLSTLLTTLKGESDFRLRAHVERRIAELDNLLSERDNASIAQTVAEARRLTELGDLDGAAVLYKQLLGGDLKQQKAELVALARRGNAELQAKKLAIESPWSKTRTEALDGGRTLLVWAFYLAVAAAALGLLRALQKRFPRDSTVLEVEDGMASGSERATATQQLCRDLVTRLRLLGAEDDAGVDIDAAEDLDRSGVANIRLITNDLADMKEIVTNTDPVRLGPFSITPQQLYTLFLPLRRPFAEQVRGTLTRTESGVRVVVSVDQRGKVRSTTIEAEARDEALAQVADFIACTLASWSASSDWQSFRDYRRALRLLETPGMTTDGGTLEQALELLQTSVTRDPNNFTAQFRLGVVLRKLGRNAESVEVFESLGEILKNAVESGDGLGKLLVMNKEFRDAVRYNLAVSLSKLDRPDSRRQAEEIFRTLMDRERLKNSTSGTRYSLLATAGLAAVLVGKMETVRMSARPKADEKIADLRSEVRELRDTLEAALPTSYMKDPVAYVSALAVALGAYGRASYIVGDLHAAAEALVAAKTRNPRLACAYINLAQVHYQRAKNRPELIEEALELLENALILSPRNRRAHHILGKIYTFKRPDYDAAVKHLQQAQRLGRRPHTDLVQAQCLVKKGEPMAALDVLAESLRLLEKPIDFRYEFFLDLLSGLTPKELPSRKRRLVLLSLSERVASAIIEVPEQRKRTLERVRKYLDLIRERVRASEQRPRSSYGKPVASAKVPTANALQPFQPIAPAAMNAGEDLRSPAARTEVDETMRPPPPPSIPMTERTAAAETGVRSASGASNRNE